MSSSTVQPETPAAPIIAKTSEPLLVKKAPSRYSITAMLEKSEEKTEVVAELPQEKLPSNHFTDTDLQNEWQKFLQTLQSDDVIVFNAISSFRLRKKDEDIIEITYPSDSAKSEFEKVRQDFFNHFMHKVNHYNIKIEYRNDVSLKKEIVTKRMLFDKLAAINPVLNELDELFKFDFNS